MERAEEMLRARFLHIRFSRRVYTDPVDCAWTDPFMNQVAIVYSEKDAEGIRDILKEIEHALGREPSDKHEGRVPIDIDLLQWNGQVLKPSDLGRDYVRDGILSLLTAGEDDEWRQ